MKTQVGLNSSAGTGIRITSRAGGSEGTRILGRSGGIEGTRFGVQLAGGLEGTGVRKCRCNS